MQSIRWLGRASDAVNNVTVPLMQSTMSQFLRCSRHVTVPPTQSTCHSAFDAVNNVTVPSMQSTCHSAFDAFECTMSHMSWPLPWHAYVTWHTYVTLSTASKAQYHICHGHCHCRIKTFECHIWEVRDDRCDVDLMRWWLVHALIQFIFSHTIYILWFYNLYKNCRREDECIRRHRHMREYKERK